MQVNKERRVAVQRLIVERFEGRVVDFARAIERSPAQVWQFMNERGIGERLARDIERKLELPIGALDGPSQEPGALSADERELLEKYRRADPAWKLMLRRVAGLRPANEKVAKALIAVASILGEREGRTLRRRAPK